MCNIRSTKMHAVALDEAHEMSVNKDIMLGPQMNISIKYCIITMLDPRFVKS